MGQREDRLTVDAVSHPLPQQIAHVRRAAAARSAAERSDHIDDGIGVNIDVQVGAAQLIGDRLRGKLVQRGDIAHDAPLQPVIGEASEEVEE